MYARSSSGSAAKISKTSKFLIQLVDILKRVQNQQVVRIKHARLAQLVEHSTDTRAVPGSNPGPRTRSKALERVLLYFSYFD